MALLVIPGACLSECWSNDMARAFARSTGVSRRAERSRPSKCCVRTVLRRAAPCEQGLKCFDLASTWRHASSVPFLLLTSDQARLPAEFKHITKRRKRN